MTGLAHITKKRNEAWNEEKSEDEVDLRYGLDQLQH